MIEITSALYVATLNRLKRVSGFAGLGMGLRETSGRLTADRAWRVYVNRKRQRRCLPPRDRVPPQIFGLPTDVIEFSSASCSSAGAGPRPTDWKSGAFADGAPIANDKGVPGSLGCIVRLRGSDQPALLSNYHILFAKNCQRGDPIWSVPDDTSTAPKSVGQVLRGKVGLVGGGTDPVFIDAAIGTLDDAITEQTYNQVVAGMAAGSRSAEPEVGGCVTKIGAATKRTQGIVVDVCYPDRWYWEYRSENAPRQILVRSASPDDPVFSRTGDSGAVIRNIKGQAVGLLWGSNARGEGVACPISAVGRALGLRFNTTLAAEAL